MALKFLHWQALASEKQYQAFAIVDPMSNNLPLLHFLQLEGVEAVSILNEAGFSGDAEKGPWIVSASEEYLAWWLEESHADSGILLSSPHDINTLSQHFASLFEAHIGQEWIFFPFYQPDYIGRMLPQFDETELGQFLGPAASIMLNIDGYWLEFHHNPAQLPTIQSEPWWKIKPHHLALLTNTEATLQNLELWLWKHYPKRLAQHINDDTDPSQLLKKAFNTYEEESVSYRALYAAIQCLFGNDVWQKEDSQAHVMNAQHKDMVSALGHVIPKILENI